MNNSYALRHISIRVPWHDNGWNGTVCATPKLNGACLKPRIAENRQDESGETLAGRLIKDLHEGQWPVLVILLILSIPRLIKRSITYHQ
ncbi:MAG: hypothetical protein KDJ65_05980 [Anaerolineae bacterium]|nr:hypothetical protein [Anaerolineae bacterium]